jgi:hypothetical protein
MGSTFLQPHLPLPKKAVTKLCAANKSKKVEFHIREITQGSKKKTYGPYSGHIEKLKEPIELKGRVIKYKPVAKLSGKTSKKMVGGAFSLIVKCKNRDIYDQAIKTIDDILGINKDKAIKITNFYTNEYYAMFKIEVIGQYSFMPNTINAINIKLAEIKGIDIKRIVDGRIWNMNKKEFINVQSKPELRKNLESKINLYHARKNSAYGHLAEKNNGSTYN